MLRRSFNFPSHCVSADGLCRNFSFGSNLTAAKMLARGVKAQHMNSSINLEPNPNPKVNSAERAVLEDWALAFNQAGFPPLEPSFANIVKEPGSSVHGIVYSMTPAAFDILCHKLFGTVTDSAANKSLHRGSTYLLEDGDVFLGD